MSSRRWPTTQSEVFTICFHPESRKVISPGHSNPDTSKLSAVLHYRNSSFTAKWLNFPLHKEYVYFRTEYVCSNQHNTQFYREVTNTICFAGNLCPESSTLGTQSFHRILDHWWVIHHQPGRRLGNLHRHGSEFRFGDKTTWLGSSFLVLFLAMTFSCSRHKMAAVSTACTWVDLDTHHALFVGQIDLTHFSRSSFCVLSTNISTKKNTL